MGSFTGTAIDRLRLEAKRLLKDIRRGDAAALRRFTQYWPPSGPSGEIRNLARTQLVIARERGYRSWAHLKTSLLGNEERVMTEKKNAVTPERRLGVYTYEEAESLLDIPQEQIRALAEEIEKKPHQYLDAVLMEKIWAKAKPFLVTLKRKEAAPKGRAEQAAYVQPLLRAAILNAGALRTTTATELRFAKREEAERVAKEQKPIAGFEWVAIAWTYARRIGPNTFHQNGDQPVDRPEMYEGMLIATGWSAEHEPKNTAVPERRLGVYTDEEAEALLGIPKGRIRTLASEIEKNPSFYLLKMDVQQRKDARILERTKGQIRDWAAEIEKQSPRYLRAEVLELVWAAAKPFLVTLKRNADHPRTPEESRIVQEAILNAGGILAMHMAQLRVATREEAEREAERQTPVSGYTWVAYEMGLEKTMQSLLDHLP